MKILISDTKQIRTIQKQFEAEFPHLRLEFFTKAHGRGESSLWDDLVDSHKTLGEFRYSHQTDKIEILPEMTVAVLEEMFRKNFGLSVQVFRRSGNAWLETTATDSWTLEKQQREAEFWASSLDAEE